MIITLLLVNTLVSLLIVFYLFKFKLGEINNLNSKLNQLDNQLNQINKIAAKNSKFIYTIEQQKETIDNLNFRIKSLTYHTENSIKEKIKKQEIQFGKIEVIYNNLFTALENQKPSLNQLSADLINLSNQIKNTLKESSIVWDKTINNSINDGSKLMLLEAAFVRFPQEKKYIEKIRKILEPKTLGNEDLLSRREAIIHLENFANRFFNVCRVQDFQYAKNFKDSVQYANRLLLDKIDDLHKANIEKQLNSMQKNLDGLKRNPLNNNLILEIEQADQSINQKTLRRFPELKKEYKTISDSLVNTLKKINLYENNKNLIENNNKAIDNAKYILDSIDDGILNKWTGPRYEEDKLHELVQLLTNNDQNSLLPSTQQYLKLAENTLFGKLNAKEKENFTRLMVKEAYKS